MFTKKFSGINKDDIAIAGGKGASLGEMSQARLPVPNGFVILSNAFDRFIQEAGIKADIDATLDSVNKEDINTVEQASERIKAIILSSEIPKDIEKEVKKEYKLLNAKFVAVRSSATSEDSKSAAWAGQLDTYLNTREENLLQNIKKCWASLFNTRALVYGLEKNLYNQHLSVAVVVQKMIESEVSGIAFSVHPVTQDYNQLIIEAGFGLGEAIVSGQITPDSYIVDKRNYNIIEKTINEQEKAIRKSKNGGNEWIGLKERGSVQKLSDNEIITLSKLIVKIEKHYGFPCDIEWAKEKDKFYITQSRPITTLTIEGKENEQIELINLQSREHSLAYCCVWRESNQIHSEPFFKPVEHILFVNAGFGKTAVWYGKDELYEIFDESGRRTQDKRFFSLISEYLHRYNAKLLQYKTGKKKITTFADLKKFYDLWIAWWSPMAIAFVLPESKTASNQIKKKALVLRKQTEKLSDDWDRIFVKAASIIFPKLADIMHLMTDDEIFKQKFVLSVVKKRENGYVFFNGKLYSPQQLDNVLAKNRLFLQEKAVKETITTIKGSEAYKGTTNGFVRVIYSKRQLPNFKEGEILVTEMTSPDYVPAIKKSAAVVTDEGGITSHAAIVARELKKPCIIGTKIATKILKDGDLVEVDANKGVVRIIKRA